MKVQRKAKDSSRSTPVVPPIVQEVLDSPGQPLDVATRSLFEPRFGADFSAVRVHTGARAAESARAVNALAYTVGQDVVFGAGQYTPHTREAQRLVAHELTHVLQQAGDSSGRTPVLQRQPDKTKEEKEEQKPATTYAGCKTDRQDTIKDAITQAKSLAARAIVAFEREIPLSYEGRAMNAHFGTLGSDQKATIIERYKHIRDNLESKTYKCAAKGKKVKEGKEVVDLCGQAPCPGSSITLFPDFGKAECPAGPVVLHEAAHNAKACDDIDKGRGYPPSSSEDNAYSYEYFASAVAAGLKEPDLLKRRPPKVP